MRRLKESWDRFPVWVRDGVGACALLGVDLWFNIFFRPEQFEGTWITAAPGLAATTLPLAARRSYPWPVSAFIGTGSLVCSVMNLGSSEIGVLVCIYTLAAYESRVRSLAALFGFIGLKSVAELLSSNLVAWIPVLFTLYGLVWARGYNQQRYRVLNVKLRDYAARLEHEQETRERLAAADERARIARDLHDIVAHSVSVMVVHAEVAKRAIPADPPRAHAALSRVEAAGRQSLTELRRLLDVLRVDSERAALEPQPRLADLETLIEQYRTAGLPVRLVADTGSRSLPASAELSVYRIVQEALTNVLKHADPREVVVSLRYIEDQLRVEVRNDGVNREPGDGTGHGLIGMRERATLAGGTFDSGRSDDRFWVSAALPV